MLSWGPCDGAAEGFECATARVPVDYRRPAGLTLALAVTRRAAADPARRTGVLVLHPGGPGNSGVNFARSSYEALPASLRDAFDVVGYDMRGVARSGQVECWDDKEYAAAVDGARGVPGPGALREAVRQGAGFAAACQERSGELVPFIGTASNAGDLDLLRQALGEETLSFYGRSFGSYVGTVYAARFPARVRAMVLDGAYDPRRYADVPYAYDAAQFTALDAALGRFLDWCGRNTAACGFGEGRPRQAFEQLKRDLDADPVITASGRPATGYTLAYRLMFNINAGKEIWPYLGQALRSAQTRQTSFLLSPPHPRRSTSSTPTWRSNAPTASTRAAGSSWAHWSAPRPRPRHCWDPRSAWGRPPTTTTTPRPAPSGRPSARAASRAPTARRVPPRSWSSARPGTPTPLPGRRNPGQDTGQRTAADLRRRRTHRLPPQRMRQHPRRRLPHHPGPARTRHRMHGRNSPGTVRPPHPGPRNRRDTRRDPGPPLTRPPHTGTHPTHTGIRAGAAAGRHAHHSPRAPSLTPLAPAFLDTSHPLEHSPSIHCNNRDAFRCIKLETIAMKSLMLPAGLRFLGNLCVARLSNAT